MRSATQVAVTLPRVWGGRQVGGAHLTLGGQRQGHPPLKCGEHTGVTTYFLALHFDVKAPYVILVFSHLRLALAVSHSLRVFFQRPPWAPLGTKGRYTDTSVASGRLLPHVTARAFRQAAAILFAILHD